MTIGPVTTVEEGTSRSPEVPVGQQGRTERLGSEKLAWRLITVLSACALALTVAIPTVWLAYSSVSDPAGGLTLDNYRTVFSNPILWRPIVNSLRVSVLTVIATLIMGLPMAWAVSRTDVPGREVLRAVVFVSFIVPPFLGAVAWVFLAGPQAGFLNVLLDGLFGIKPFDIYTLTGLAFVMALFLYPYTFIFTTGSLDSIGAEIEEAAAIAGAGIFQRTVRVILPLASPAIAGAVVLTFLQSMALFGAPAIIAVPAGEHVITTQLFLFFAFPPQLELAAAYGMPLVFLAAGTFYLRRRVLGRRGFATITGKGARAYQIKLGAWRWVLGAYCWSIIALAMVLPVGALVFMAFAESWIRPGSGWTLDSFRWVFDRALDPVLNSARFAAIAAVLSVILGLAVAYLNERHRNRTNEGLALLTSAPIVMPGMIIAIGMFAAYSQPPLALTGTGLIIILVMWGRFVPAALQNITPAVTSLDRSLEEAARSVGAGPLRTLRSIVVPLSAPSLISAWIFCFVLAVNELSAVILLVSIETEVMSSLAMGLFNQSSYERLGALGVTQVLVTMAAVVVGRLFVRRLSSRGRR